MSKDFAETFTCRLRLDELCRERGIVNKHGEPDIAELARIASIHKNVVRRLIRHETSGIDFTTLTRLCISLRCSPNDLFVIE